MLLWSPSTSMLLAAAIVPVAAAQTTPVPQMPPMVVHQVVGPTGAQGIKFGLVMPPTGAVPLPRLAIQLTSDYTTTLTPGPGVPADPLYYAGACPWLVAAGWACASLDLPSHGANVLPGEPLGIAGWRWRIDRGIDFIGNSSGNIDLMVDFLARNKLVNGTALAVMGVSRGGFLAAHYASHVFGTDKVAAVGLLSPVTNLSLLAEFEAENATIEAALQPLELAAHAARLAPANVWTIIGDEDPRVFTDACIGTMREVMCANCTTRTAFSCSACAPGLGDKQLRVIKEPKGHTVPPSSDPAATFKELASWVQRL